MLTLLPSTEYKLEDLGRQLYAQNPRASAFLTGDLREGCQSFTILESVTDWTEKLKMIATLLADNKLARLLYGHHSLDDGSSL